MKNLIHMAEPATGYWQDLKWHQLPANSYACAILKWEKQVLVGGFQLNETQIQIPGYWRNGEWCTLSVPHANNHSAVLTLAISGPFIYAGGFSGNSFGTQVAGYWKNGEWRSLPSLHEEKNASVSALVISGEDVFAAGYCVNQDHVLVPGY